MIAIALATPLSYSLGLTSRPASSCARAGQAQAVLDMIKPSSTPSKPSLSDRVPDCPATIWDAENLDIEEWQQKYREENLPTCPIEVVASPEDNAAGAAYFKERAEEFKEMLLKHGTIHFKGFDLMKDEKGFREMWEGLQLDACLDPIHNSGLRKFFSKEDAVYEEVNKQSLSQHYIGLHQECGGGKTATTGAFVCFQKATVTGGEFFIADGERILRDMDTETLKELYDKQLRISVSNLDLGVVGAVPSQYKADAMEWLREKVGEAVAPKFDMELDMVWGADGNPLRLQAIEEIQSPINRHPVTGRPIWFCNLHNHARFLRQRRPCSVPEVGMTDVYYGDLSVIPGDALQKMNEACEKHIVTIKMEPGEVLLCDNYRVLHGRDTFEGDRTHAVSWFGTGGDMQEKPDDLLNSFMNKFVVGD